MQEWTESILVAGSVVTSYHQYIEDILRRLEVVNEELEDNNMM
jgi:hypothetical protein